METHVQLFGAAQLTSGASSIKFLPDKRFLLLAYLAYRSDWVARDHLAFLFWSDSDSQTARKNLRHLISRVRALDFVILESQDEHLRWLVNTDVTKFQVFLGQGAWEHAISLYQGKLLEGINPDIRELEDWLSTEQENLHSAYREALLNYSQQLEVQERFSEAQALLAKLFKQDVMAEDTIQAYLRTALKSGQRNEALKAFELFQTTLFAELHLQPLESTKQLALALAQLSDAPERHHTNTLTPKPEIAQAPKLNNFPVLNTSFVGRDEKLSEIAAAINEPKIRLLTLIGPGGIGKTRLSVQVGEDQYQHFSSGATFVPLANLANTQNIVPAIASALNLSFTNNASLEEQLKTFLRDKNMLLVLDNLEHLIEGAGIIFELLETCPMLKILTTSREALDFQNEYLIEVTGLRVPTNEHDENLETYDAVQLFVRLARRVNPRFSLEPDTKPYVARLCKMLYGSPLAIELATSWLRLLNVQEVSTEIQKSLDFLNVTQPDLPVRHRSLRAVFEHSWNLLTELEQTALKRLAVFKGGFRKDAAEKITGVGLRTLLTLVNKSLLQQTATGRIERHVMVSEFSLEKLTQDQFEYVLQLEKHGLYYFEFLENHAMGDANDQQYIKEIDEDLENIRSAWHWALINTRADQLMRSTDLVVFYDRQARFEEGSRLFKEAIDVLNPDDVRHHAALGKALVDTAWLYRRLGKLEARDYAEQAVNILRQSSEHPEILMKALNTLSAFSIDAGESQRTRILLTEALILAREQENIQSQFNCLTNLAALEEDAGSFQYAKQLYEEILNLQQKTNNPFGIAMTLNNLGRLGLVMLELEVASSHLSRALQLSEQVNFDLLIPYLYSNLSQTAYKQKDYGLARDLCLKAISIKENVDLKVKATVYMTLGRTETALGNMSDARNYFQKSLEIVWKIKELPIVMENLVGLAELNFKLGKFEKSFKLLNIVVQHPATEPWFKKDAEELMAVLKKQKILMKLYKPTHEQLIDIIESILN
jgi:predicted ATPase/DNA-binding SARP family transcriptional activator